MERSSKNVVYIWIPDRLYRHTRIFVDHAAKNLASNFTTDFTHITSSGRKKILRNHINNPWQTPAIEILIILQILFY